uniref:Uncharacterized protein n=1 Tax=Panagrolaimus sp. ES5 TaxID=591445 RepID=A0AC34FGJ9_9BILA
MSDAEIVEAFTNLTVTDEYIEFIAKFLSCRIEIYENGRLKKFGKRETENKIFTLVLALENGRYSVVLNL